MAPELDDTRQRLIIAAGEVFAEQGFQPATVRDICTRAKANVAAVNYYFGDKRGLYVETVQQACGAANLLGRAWPEGLSPTAKLQLFIQRWLEHFLDESRPAWHAKLMLREMAEPTEACEKLVEAYIRPMAITLRGILAELCPTGLTDEQQWLVGFSIVGQCLFYKVHRPVAELLLGVERYRELDVPRLAAHIAGFSLAALGHAPPLPAIDHSEGDPR